MHRVCQALQSALGHMYGLAMDYVVCVSVPYGNTEGPVGYTSVRRLQHVYMWMRVDVVRAVCAIHGAPYREANIGHKP